MPVSSSTSSAFPRTLSRSASRFSPSKRIHDGSLFETAAIPLCSGPQLCSPPRSSLPLRSNVAEQPRLLRPSTTCVVTSACIGYANHLPRQLVVWGLTPHKIHSLVGCSSVIAILRQSGTTPELLNSFPPPEAHQTNENQRDPQWLVDVHPAVIASDDHGGESTSRNNHNWRLTRDDYCSANQQNPEDRRQ